MGSGSGKNLSRIQGSEKHLIPDPQHCFLVEFLVSKMPFLSLKETDEKKFIACPNVGVLFLFSKSPFLSLKRRLELMRKRFAVLFS
jgi:hypothetical protein